MEDESSESKLLLLLCIRSAFEPDGHPVSASGRDATGFSQPNLALRSSASYKWQTNVVQDWAEKIPSHLVRSQIPDVHLARTRSEYKVEVVVWIPTTRLPFVLRQIEAEKIIFGTHRLHF